MYQCWVTSHTAGMTNDAHEDSNAAASHSLPSCCPCNWRKGRGHNPNWTRSWRLLVSGLHSFPLIWEDFKFFLSQMLFYCIHIRLSCFLIKSSLWPPNLTTLPGWVKMKYYKITFMVFCYIAYFLPHCLLFISFCLFSSLCLHLWLSLFPSWNGLYQLFWIEV